MYYIVYIGDLLNITIRNINDATYRQLKAKAALEGVTIGTAITQAIEFWISALGSTKKKGSIMDLKPVSMGKENEHLSEDIDKILY